MAVLIDTNVLSELARPRPDPEVMRYVAALPQSFLSVLTMHELWHGAHLVSSRTKRARLISWVQEIEQKFAAQILPISASVASRSAQLRAEHSREGRQLHIEDAMIAATAVAVEPIKRNRD